MQIKKVFQPIIALLTENASATVEDVLDQVKALAAAKTGGGGSKASTYLMIDGAVAAIRCYAHKKWFSPEDTEFGKKATSPTGYNNMTKHGLAQWNASRATYQKGKDAALDALQANEIDADELRARIAKLDEAKGNFEEHPQGGYETLADLVEAYGLDVDADEVAAIDAANAE